MVEGTPEKLAVHVGGLANLGDAKVFKCLQCNKKKLIETLIFY